MQLHLSGHKEQGLTGVSAWHFTAAVQGLEYVDGGNSMCQGVSMVIDGCRIDRLVQTAEYNIIVTEELPLKMGQMVMLAPGQFAQQTIDTIETFTCHAATVTIRTAETCYQDIPIDGPPPFEAAHTRIMKSASPIVPCSLSFQCTSRDCAANGGGSTQL